jgi:hypothetical protein
LLSNTKYESGYSRTVNKSVYGKNKYILFASIIATLNVLLYENFLASLAVVLLEVLILGYYFFRNDITRYLGYYLMFLCLSLEFDALVGSEAFYGFKNFRILGINLGVISLLPPAIKMLVKGVRMKELKARFPKLYKFETILFLMSIMGVFFGLLTYLINDNNIQNLENSIVEFINVCYSMMAVPILISLIYIHILMYEREKINILKDYLIAVLVGISVSLVISILSGKQGYYGGVNTLIVSNVIRYIPFLMVLMFYENLNSRIVVTAAAFIGMALSLVYNASGKLIILYMMVPIAIVAILWKRKKYVIAQLFIFLIPVLVIIALYLIGNLREESMLFNSKYNQALSMLTFWEPNWFENMADSPKFRISEVLNIAVEYAEKPWYLLFGKGYMGSIKDHLQLFFYSDNGGGFSLPQWANDTFYSVHETFNILFLYHGLFGIGVYIYMLKQVLKYFTTSPWLLMGSFWFLMVYGFSVTMSAFGMVCLLIGLTELDTEGIL